MTAPLANEPARTTRPRVNGVICVVLALILGATSAVWFWVGADEGAVVGPALASALLAVLSALIAVLAFQIASRPETARSLVGPLQLFTILTAVIGFVAAALGIALGGVTGSYVAIGAGIDVLVTSIIVVIQGVLLFGAAKHRA